MTALAVVVAAVVCALLAGLGPEVISRLPEPEPKDAESAGDPAGEGADRVVEPAEIDEPKELYARIAAIPRLRAGLVAAGAVAGALVGWRIGWNGALPLMSYLVPLALVLSVVDWRTRLLPTRLIAPSYGVVVLLVLLAAGLDGSWHEAARAGYGWLVWGGLFVLLWLVYPRGMGYGDVRFSGLLGLGLGVLGWAQLLVGLYASFLVGGVLGFVLSRVGVVERKSYPFGPFMALGALLGVLVGAPIMGGLGY